MVHVGAAGKHRIDWQFAGNIESSGTVSTDANQDVSKVVVSEKYSRWLESLLRCFRSNFFRSHKAEREMLQSGSLACKLRNATKHTIPAIPWIC